jgi:MSHA biogenesis protein MshN
VSVINKMLQDLDRRNAAAAGTPPDLKQVRAVGHEGRGREWFWRIVAALLLAVLTWVGWVAYQMRPRTVITELAYKAAEDARARPATTPVSGTPGEVAKAAPEAAPPAPAEPVNPTPADVSQPASENTKPPAETLRLAQMIETPPADKPVVVQQPAVAPEPKKPAPPKPAPQAAPLPASAPVAATTPSKVERRDRTVPPTEKAEQEFRRSAELLKRGRGPEAEEGFVSALQTDPTHRAARQALVALNLERGNIEAARRHLQDGLLVDPAQPDFAVALGRIYVQRGELPVALDVLQKAAPAAGNYPELHFLRGSVLQRLARHRDATDAYRTALNLQVSHPQAWVGLGISLEALEQRREAAEAFRRALAAGPVSAELRSFTEQRIRALQ